MTASRKGSGGRPQGSMEMRIQDEFYAELGHRLLKFRINSDLSQTVLAQQVGCHRNTIHRWEKGEDSMDLWMLLRVCDVLRVSIFQLLPPIDLTWGDQKPLTARQTRWSNFRALKAERDPAPTRKELRQAGMCL